jgi:hypothetical protein
MGGRGRTLVKELLDPREPITAAAGDCMASLSDLLPELTGVEVHHRRYVRFHYGRTVVDRPLPTPDVCVACRFLIRHRQERSAI